MVCILERRSRVKIMEEKVILQIMEGRDMA
jgi:hypothetical protein